MDLGMTSPEGDRKSLFAAHEFLLKTKLKDVHPIGDDKRSLATNQLNDGKAIVAELKSRALQQTQS